MSFLDDLNNIDIDAEKKRVADAELDRRNKEISEDANKILTSLKNRIRIAHIYKGKKFIKFYVKDSYYGPVDEECYFSPYGFDRNYSDISSMEYLKDLLCKGIKDMGFTNYNVTIGIHKRERDMKKNGKVVYSFIGKPKKETYISACSLCIEAHW